jgi:hypothetical protein
MTIREVPRSFEYTCDRCGETHVQQNAHGHYHNSRPPEWAGLSLVRDVHRNDIYTIPGDKEEALLCRDCMERAFDLVRKFLRR